MGELPDNATVLKFRAQQEHMELDELRVCFDDSRVRAVTNPALRSRMNVLIDTAQRDLHGLGDGAEGNVRDWVSMGKRQATGSRVKRETLALVLGALLRDAGLDGGIGRVADRLFRSLSERTGVELRVVATVGDSEFLDRTLELARLRFPDTSVWGLPIMAHEFGHYVARSLPHADPDARGDIWPVALAIDEETDVDAQTLAEQQNASVAMQDVLRKRAVSHLNELFADVYATYALGASYALAAIILRAKVGDVEDLRPSSESDSHPSWARRVMTMCAALRRMSTVTGEVRHRLMADRLIEPLWSRIAGAHGRQDPLIGHAEPQARRLVDALIDHAPQRLRSTDHGQGPQIRALLAATTPIQRNAVPAGSNVLQVVEAAWSWRAGEWSAEPRALQRVSQRALQLALLVDL